MIPKEYERHYQFNIKIEDDIHNDPLQQAKTQCSLSTLEEKTDQIMAPIYNKLIKEYNAYPNFLAYLSRKYSQFNLHTETGSFFEYTLLYAAKCLPLASDLKNDLFLSLNEMSLLAIGIADDDFFREKTSHFDDRKDFEEDPHSVKNQLLRQLLRNVKSGFEQIHPDYFNHREEFDYGMRENAQFRLHIRMKHAILSFLKNPILVADCLIRNADLIPDQQQLSLIAKMLQQEINHFKDLPNGIANNRLNYLQRCLSIISDKYYIEKEPDGYIEMGGVGPKEKKQVTYPDNPDYNIYYLVKNRQEPATLMRLEKLIQEIFYYDNKEVDYHLEQTLMRLAKENDVESAWFLMKHSFVNHAYAAYGFAFSGCVQQINLILDSIHNSNCLIQFVPHKKYEVIESAAKGLSDGGYFESEEKLLHILPAIKERDLIRKILEVGKELNLIKFDIDKLLTQVLPTIQNDLPSSASNRKIMMMVPMRITLPESSPKPKPYSAVSPGTLMFNQQQKTAEPEVKPNCSNVNKI